MPDTIATKVVPLQDAGRHGRVAGDSLLVHGRANSIGGFKFRYLFIMLLSHRLILRINIFVCQLTPRCACDVDSRSTQQVKVSLTTAQPRREWQLCLRKYIAR